MIRRAAICGLSVLALRWKGDAGASGESTAWAGNVHQTRGGSKATEQLLARPSSLPSEPERPSTNFALARGMYISCGVPCNIRACLQKQQHIHACHVYCYSSLLYREAMLLPADTMTTQMVLAGYYYTAVVVYCFLWRTYVCNTALSTWYLAQIRYAGWYRLSSSST